MSYVNYERYMSYVYRFYELYKLCKLYEYFYESLKIIGNRLKSLDVCFKKMLDIFC